MKPVQIMHGGNVAMLANNALELATLLGETENDQIRFHAEREAFEDAVVIEEMEEFAKGRDDQAYRTQAEIDVNTGIIRFFEGAFEAQNDPFRHDPGEITVRVDANDGDDVVRLATARLPVTLSTDTQNDVMGEVMDELAEECGYESGDAMWEKLCGESTAWPEGGDSDGTRDVLVDIEGDDAAEKDAREQFTDLCRESLRKYCGVEAS